MANSYIIILLIPLLFSLTLLGSQEPKIWTDSKDDKPIIVIDSFAKVVNKIKPSVIGIRVKTKEGKKIQGSGTIIHPDGYVLTVAHLFPKGFKSITVFTHKDIKHKASFIGRDIDTDIAIIKISAQKKFKFLKLADSDKTQVGDWALAVGNPGYFEFTTTIGIISYIGRDSDIIRYSWMHQTDAAINPGNSGGPLIDIKGCVMGVVSTRAPWHENIGFAVPSNLAKVVMPYLVKYGKVNRSWLGAVVSNVNQQGKTLLVSNGDFSNPDLVSDLVVVISVHKDGPADDAGIEIGDIIYNVNGEHIDSMKKLAWIISMAGIGKTVTMKVLRGAKPLDLKVKLAPEPNEKSL